MWFFIFTYNLISNIFEKTAIIIKILTHNFKSSLENKVEQTKKENICVSSLHLKEYEEKNLEAFTQNRLFMRDKIMNISSFNLSIFSLMCIFVFYRLYFRMGAPTEKENIIGKSGKSNHIFTWLNNSQFLVSSSIMSITHFSSNTQKPSKLYG